MHANPAELLGLDNDPVLRRLLVACGTDESGSAYDRFCALAAALPLCEGHPIAESTRAALTAATGLTAPLCPHTADAYWRAWVDIHWFGRPAAEVLPATCPHCAPAAPTLLAADDLPALPDPAAVVEEGDDLSAWSHRLGAALPEVGVAMVALPTDYTFIRPDPYHAAEALHTVGKAARGVTGAAARDLLLTQALRVWGECALPRGVTLLFRGGAPAAVAAALDYLSACDRLPDVVYIPDRPTDVAPLVGIFPRVRTGYAVRATDTPAEMNEKRRAYAAVAPLGRAVVLQE